MCLFVNFNVFNLKFSLKIKIKFKIPKPNYYELDIRSTIIYK